MKKSDAGGLVHGDKYGVVYVVENQANGKYYIGQTVRPVTERWRQHIGSKSKCTRLAAAVKKYGRQWFTLTVVAEARTRAELNQLELLWIIATKSSESGIGYNVMVGATHTEGTAQKISAAKKGKRFSEEHKAALSAAWKPKVISEQGKRNHLQSLIARTGQKRTDEQRLRMSLAHKGKPHSEARKAVQSEVMKKAWMSRHRPTAEEKRESQKVRSRNWYLRKKNGGVANEVAC